MKIIHESYFFRSHRRFHGWLFEANRSSSAWCSVKFDKMIKFRIRSHRNIRWQWLKIVSTGQKSVGISERGCSWNGGYWRLGWPSFIHYSTLYGTFRCIRCIRTRKISRSRCTFRVCSVWQRGVRSSITAWLIWSHSDVVVRWWRGSIGYCSCGLGYCRMGDFRVTVWICGHRAGWSCVIAGCRAPMWSIGIWVGVLWRGGAQSVTLIGWRPVDSSSAIGTNSRTTIQTSVSRSVSMIGAPLHFSFLMLLVQFLKPHTGPYVLLPFTQQIISFSWLDTPTDQQNY